MYSSIYEALQKDFVKIRHLYSGDCYDQSLFDETSADIRRIRAKIVKKSKVESRKLILYCIDTLFEIIAENDKSKTYDFADTIHNMPEISLGMRNIYSFDKEILAFQKKYGKNYFPDFKKMKPKFQSKVPKNAAEYFNPKADESFKRLHPVGYYILIAIGLTALLLPQILYAVYILLIDPIEQIRPDVTLLDGFLFFTGWFGCLIFGVGLFNIVSAWIHQHLGHKLTIICSLLGGAMVTLSLLFLYR